MIAKIWADVWVVNEAERHNVDVQCFFFFPFLDLFITRKSQIFHCFLILGWKVIILTFCSRHPIVKWAQRSDKIYINVDLPEAKDVSHKLEPEGRFIFSAAKDGIPYEVDIELFDNINVKVWKSMVLGSLAFWKWNAPVWWFVYEVKYWTFLQESKCNVGVRCIAYVIKKEENKWWDRLLKQGGKPPAFIKVDWDKWVDEEDENNGNCGPFVTNVLGTHNGTAWCTEVLMLSIFLFSKQSLPWWTLVRRIPRYDKTFWNIPIPIAGFSELLSSGEKAKRYRNRERTIRLNWLLKKFTHCQV